LLVNFIEHGLHHFNLLGVFLAKWIEHALVGARCNHAARDAELLPNPGRGGPLAQRVILEE
jgi:hypothetical protein